MSRPSESYVVYDNIADVTVGATSTLLVAADPSGAPHEATVIVPPNSDTTLGIRVAFGQDATATSPCLYPGQTAKFTTKQDIKGIQAGASSVVVSIILGRG